MNVFNKASVSFFSACLLAATPLYAHSDIGQGISETSLLEQGAHISHNRQTGEVGFIGSNAGHPLTIPHTTAGQTPASAAMNALEAYGQLFGLKEPAKELTLMNQSNVDANRSRFRYQQNYQGIPVIGGELNINIGAGNTLLSINGEIAPALKLTTEAKTSAIQATETAVTAVAKWYPVTRYDLQASSPVLSVYAPQLLRPGTDPVRLVWRTEVRSKSMSPIRELVLIDAISGNVTEQFNQIDTAQDRETYTSNATSSLPGTLVCNESDPTCSAGTSAGDTDAVSAHLYAGDTYGFYSSKHGRDGIDDAGMTIISSVDWDDGYSCPNAFWNGSQMVYCDTLPLADDVVAHELTHGVTEHTSNLFYYYQSGAISESLSDTWGEFVDLSNGSGTDDSTVRWQMGEDATAIGGTIRDMSDPTLYSDPDKMSSINYVTDSSDNGGVHTNSGVNNKAVYLMVDGDSFNGTTVTGIGIDKVAKIYYEAQTNLLTSGSDYLDLHNALYQGCQNLVGTDDITTNDCNQVRTATSAVEMDQEPVLNFNPDADFCPAGQGVATTAFSDDLESGVGNWTFSNAGSTQNWMAWSSNAYYSYYGPYATSGVESLFGEDVSTVTDQRARISVNVPSGTPYLHFRHAFNLESNFDGGVLEYSTDGTNWIDATSLIDAGQDYNNSISTCCSNPLAGRSAFSGDSHGYVSTRLNLTSLAGQTVQFRWRLGTDSSVNTDGWFLDDAKVYTCETTSTLTFSNAAYSVAEDGVSATITVSRNDSSAGSASVNYAVTAGTAVNGSDFTASTGTLTWTDGDSTDKTFTVPVIDDGIYEDDENINLTLSNPSGAVLGAPPIASLTISDDDPQPVIAFSNATYSSSENSGGATITVQRSGNSNGAISIDYSISAGSAKAGSDYIATSDTLSWADGDSADKSFTITLVNDDSHEDTETANLFLSNATGEAAIGTPGSATLTISDDDAVSSSSSGGGGGGVLGWPFLLLTLLWRAVPSFLSRRGRAD